MQTDKETRCSSPAVTYGRVLFGLPVSGEDVRRAREIFAIVPQLAEIFMNPTIPQEKKYNVIDKVFPEKMRNFLKTACRNRRMDIIDGIFAAYDRCVDEQEKVVKAVLYCTTPPSGEQKSGMETFLCRKYKAARAQISVRTDEKLLGGFILRVGCDEYDWSIKGRLDRLAQKLTWR